MSERYTELMDAAQEQQMKNEALALSRIQALAAPEIDPDFDGKNCIECGGGIPAKRLELLKIRCVGCQDTKERGSKLFRR